MAHQNIEIEIQVNIENPKGLLAFLYKNAKFAAQKHQVDEYYSPPHRDFLAVRPVSEWLRLRDADGKCTINYKNWHYEPDGKSHFCDEIEETVGSIEQMRKIFKVLNFKTLVTVDKIRQTWVYNDYEIAVDAIKGLGDFVEIEYIGKESQVKPAEITAQMVAFLKKQGCGKITRNYVGYPFLLLFPGEVKYEEQ